MSTRGELSRTWAVLATVFVVALVGAAATAFSLGRSHHQGTTATAAAQQTPKATKPPVPQPRLALSGAVHGVFAWDHHAVVRAANGTFADVVVTDAKGNALPGRTSTDGHTWQSASTLVPNTAYTAQLTLQRVDGSTLDKSVRFKAGPPQHLVTSTISPLGTVGVGAPIIVRFSRHVDDHAAIEKRLTVAMSQPVVGAWRWFGDNEVHFRPRDYWPAGEHVTVHADLTGVQINSTSWSEESHTAQFSVGPAHVSTVDVTAHTMTVTSNGTVLRVLPVSTGRDKYPTVGGVHIVLEKEPKKIMDSATVGIPKGNPDYYYETVFWDVRISNGGAFVHAAPWSVGDQGVRNVSHGCVNVSVANAEWFYGLSRYGDVVNVIHSSVPPNYWDAGMADWNYSWKTWLKGSATGQRG